ncbi:MAG TPA: HAD family hydrolase [Gemmatimonadales bacterium]|nr:HAD family hydrolase [Gemmatimonadales bacterium]
MRDVVLFDFGGTLDADGDRWAVRFHQAYARAGGRVAFSAFEPVFRASDRRLEAEPAVRTMGLREMVAAQAGLLRELLPGAEGAALDQAAEHFHHDSLAIVHRNRPMLERLATRYRLGVVSNFTGNLDRCLAELDLLRLFAVTADSLVVGWSKPDPRLFLHALGALDAGTEMAWMVGDNFEADVRPAAALGLATCWLVPAGRALPALDVATHRIARLTDLPPLLA